MLVIFWGLTPLQSAIFGAQEVILNDQVTMADSQALAPLDQQLVSMDALILQTAYGLSWLGRSFPAFTSSGYALLPFGPIGGASNSAPVETWSSSATALSTDIDCWPAIISPTVSKVQFTFDNGKNCVAEVGIFSSARFAEDTAFVTLYIGYHMEAHLDYFLSGPNCTSEASHQFLAIWVPKPPTGVKMDDITAMFCETSYKKQSVSITVSSPDGRPDDSSLVALGEPEDLSDAEFNATAFEYLIGTGVSPQPLIRDYPRDLIVEQFPALNQSLAWPTTNMVGFALGHANNSLEILGNATVLQEVFSKAHKTLFSAAIPQLLVETRSPARRAGTAQYTLFGVVASRAIAAAVEILLLVVCLLVGGTIWSICVSKSSLAEDPGGKGALFTVLGESDALLDIFARKDCHDDIGLRRNIKGKCYELSSEDSASGKPFTAIKVVSAGRVSPPNTNNDKSHPSTNIDNGVSYIPVHPAALRPATGLGFIGVLLAAIGILVFLKLRDRELGGTLLWRSCTTISVNHADDDRTTTPDEQLRGSPADRELCPDHIRYSHRTISDSPEPTPVSRAAIPRSSQGEAVSEDYHRHHLCFSPATVCSLASVEGRARVASQSLHRISSRERPRRSTRCSVQRAPYSGYFVNFFRAISVDGVAARHHKTNAFHVSPLSPFLCHLSKYNYWN